MIKLPFASIKGQPNIKALQVLVPCMQMYGEECPVLQEVQTWMKDPSLEDMARRYWKKRSYFYQGFVRESPFLESDSPVNPIRQFIIGPQIFTTIKGALMDPELEELPTDYVRGLDFRISKGAKGGFADYNGSKWARKESALTEAEQAAVDAHGLFDLSTFLPKKPTDVELKVIKEMFEASVDGQPYDTERWGQYFRPAGVQAPAGGSAPAVTVDGHGDVHESPAKPALRVSAPVSDFDDEDAPAPTAPVAKPAGGGQKAEDILAMIRARQAK
jgi:hypothetical protein